MFQQFGAKPTSADLQQYARSSQWNGRFFENIERTQVDVNLRTLPKILYKQFFQKAQRAPAGKLPIAPFDIRTFMQPVPSAKTAWYGHSAVLLRLRGLSVLIDPMFSANAAPISPFPVKRFSDHTLDIIGSFPEIDLLLLSHDHYDHLDYASIRRLKAKTRHFFVALGIGRHLRRWGVEADKITEFNWWETHSYGDIQVTFTPTRHFSGRGLKDKAHSLWGGWALRSADENIWFSGDSGYGLHFKEIGSRLGPFDLAFMECGQYNPQWRQIHMFPEESVCAAKETGTRKVIPVHWAGFTLAQHAWTEPVERFIAEADRQQVDYCLPELGEIIDLHSDKKVKWWQ